MDKIKLFLMDITPYWTLISVLIIMVLKFLMDFNLAKKTIKYFYWISLRRILGTRPHKISGLYKQRWEIEENQNYANVGDRQSLIVIKQLGNYCYGEFTAKGKQEVYHIFGEIIDRKIIGHWQSKTSPLGYFGAFQLTIVDDKTLEGFWIGHSNKIPTKLNIYSWKFTAVTDTSKPLALLQIKVFMRRFLSRQYTLKRKA